jgi:hypothetical protein
MLSVYVYLGSRKSEKGRLNPKNNGFMVER